MKSKKTKYLLGGVIFISAAVGLYFGLIKDKSPKISYKEHIVKKGDLEISVQATGSIQPENRLVVKPQIAGRIDSILIEEGKRVSAGQVMAWMSSNDRAALIDMARSSSAEEQKRWEEIYKPSPIIAPLGGIVIAKQVERGQTVGTGDTVFVISDRLIILAQVDETDLGKISLNQPVEIRVDAYNDQVVTGKVIRIAYESKQVNNVTIYEIRILPDNVPEFMRSGMTTSVKFIQNKKENILLAPVSFLARPQKDSGSDSTLNPGDSMTVLSPSANPKDPPKSQDIVIGH